MEGWRECTGVGGARGREGGRGLNENAPGREMGGLQVRAGKADQYVGEWVNCLPHSAIRVADGLQMTSLRHKCKSTNRHTLGTWAGLHTR